VPKLKNEPVDLTESPFDNPAKTSAYIDEKLNNRVIGLPDTIASMMKEMLSNDMEKMFCNIVEKLAKMVEEERKVNTRLISPPHTIETMKNQKLSNGIEKMFCNICNI